MPRIKSLLIWLGTLCSMPNLSHAIEGVPGTLDTTFGTNGMAFIAISPSVSVVADIAAQTDGKLVLGGTCVLNTISTLCAARLLSDGSLDNSFGSGGIVKLTSYPNNVYINAIAIQPDGKILLAGGCTRGDGRTDFCAIRLGTTGVPDQTFGVGGKASISAGISSAHAWSFALQPDGGMVLAGYCNVAQGLSDGCAIRMLSDGTIDATFANAGVLVPIGTSRQVNQVSRYPDGKLVFSGICGDGLTNQQDFCVQRFSFNGIADSSFGNAGESRFAVGPGNDYPRSMRMQPDGRLLLTGSCSDTPFVYKCFARLNVDGTLDVNFGTNGTIVTPDDGGLHATLLHPDGKFLTQSAYSVLRRRNGDGSFDNSFGPAGQIPAGFAPTSTSAFWLQSDGKPVLAASCDEAGITKFCVARYEGGPFGYKNCSLDIDGDNRVLATTDSLIHARIALGITGSAVTNGITFPPTATRNTWPLIRDYLVTQCGMSLVQ